jgi:hypothetical protein
VELGDANGEALKRVGCGERLLQSRPHRAALDAATYRAPGGTIRRGRERCALRRERVPDRGADRRAVARGQGGSPVLLREVAGSRTASPIIAEQ